MPHGDICKGKISFYVVLFSLTSSIFLTSYNLAPCIASYQVGSFQISKFYYLLALVVLSSITKNEEIVRKMDPRPIYFGFWCLMTNTTKLD